MEIVAIGQTVSIGPPVGDVIEPLTGTIIGATIRAGGVSYEVVWWSGNERKSAWMEPEEIRPVGRQKGLRIGFGAA